MHKSLVVLGAVAGMLAVGISAAAQPSAARRPNVLLIMSDDLNNDLGNLRSSDREDAEHRSAGAARSPLRPCLHPVPALQPKPGVAADRTPSRHDWHLRARHRVPQNKPDVVTLPQMFRNNGYIAARVAKIYHYGVPGQIGTPGLDDAPSWDVTVNPRGVDKDEEPLLTNYTPGRGLGSALAFHASTARDEEHTDGKVATETIALLEANRDRPFFVAAGFYRPHCPFIAPQKYFDMYPLAKMRVPQVSPATLAQHPDAAFFTRPPNWGLTEQQEREVIRAYYASISFMDANVGRLLDALDRLKLTDNTIVVFMSDHGYSLGERGQWMKQMLFERSARSPLILAGPGVRAKGKGSSRIVEYLDLYPTVLRDGRSGHKSSDHHPTATVSRTPAGPIVPSRRRSSRPTRCSSNSPRSSSSGRSSGRRRRALRTPRSKSRSFGCTTRLARSEPLHAGMRKRSSVSSRHIDIAAGGFVADGRIARQGVQVDDPSRGGRHQVQQSREAANVANQRFGLHLFA